MFYNFTAILLDENFAETDVIPCDIQPFERVMKFEDNIEIEVVKRIFCDVHPVINPAGYLLAAGALYKIMHIKAWEDYLEIWLALSERGLP